MRIDKWWPGVRHAVHSAFCGISRIASLAQRRLPLHEIEVLAAEHSLAALVLDVEKLDQDAVVDLLGMGRACRTRVMCEVIVSPI